jgi:hypothetical protein
MLAGFLVYGIDRRCGDVAESEMKCIVLVPHPALPAYAVTEGSPSCPSFLRAWSERSVSFKHSSA